MIYFTSDLHFYYHNIIKHTNRPFSNIEEMHKILIKNWNRKVRPSDDIYILRDITLKGAAYVNQIIPKLNGHKY